jgi:hypothetical protein
VYLFFRNVYGEAHPMILTKRFKTMSLSVFLAVVLLAAAAGCKRDHQASSGELPDNRGGPALNLTVLLSGLEIPWDIDIATCRESPSGQTPGSRFPANMALDTMTK